jgi:hypothetical protein
MEEVDHALAARRHADKASSGSGSAEPAVLVGLAQTEALLAVAAAIERLAEALSGRDEPRLSPVRGQADHIAEVRRKYPNAYMPWSAEADAALLADHRAGHDVTTLADTFGRQPSAIRSRLNHLGANAPAAQATDPGAAPDASPRP